MIELRDGTLRARVRPGRGFEISSLTAGGHEILSVMPWEADPAVPAAGEDAWTRAWTGGWQIAAPSSGMACVAEGVRQGFHGNASQAAWTLTGSTASSASASWDDDAGLRLERIIALRAGSVQVTTTARNTGRTVRHLIATEHLILGSALLVRDLMIEASGCVADIGAQGEVVGPPEPWPGDGWNRFAAAGPSVRFSALYNSGGRVRLADRGGTTMVTVRWDADVLPFAWLWQEIEATADQPWAGRGRALGIEPSMTAHSAGLTAAIDDGTAHRLQPGGALSWWVELTPSVAA